MMNGSRTRPFIFLPHPPFRFAHSCSFPYYSRIYASYFTYALLCTSLLSYQTSHNRIEFMTA
ncbi:hypothetical protein BDV11DRAFT_187459 [Aspergillus similis]